MLRALATITAALTLAGGAGADLLPQPAELEPNVRFWKRIYTEVDGNGGLIHDSEHLDVVYEKISLPPGLSHRSRERRIEQAKDRIRASLRRLAQGQRSGLSEYDAAILAHWPTGVSDATLRAAAGRVRFQLGQADKFRAGLIRSGRWRDHIVEVLESKGVPTELVALPHVESSYNPTAYSRVGAAGLWQFTRGTGRRFLRVDTVVDERMDPYRATEAAADLLQDNFRRLDSWPLAITGYNHGVAGMARAVRKLGTNDIAVIARNYQSRSFGFASRNFYSEFLAALDIDRNATEYFGPLTPDRPVDYELVELDHYYPASTLARALGVDKDLLRQHNPALRPAVWDGPKYAPRGFTLRVPRNAAGRPVQLALAEVPATQRFTTQHRDRYYKVQRGDTLSTIARRHRVGISELVALNHLRSRHSIRAGQVLILPDHYGGGVQVAQQEPPADGLYRVQRGDTLSVIAARYGVSQTALARENNLHNRHILQIGQSLRLPGFGTRVAMAPKPPPPPEPAPAEPPQEETRPEPIVVASVAPERPPVAVDPDPAPPQPVAPTPEAGTPASPERTSESTREAAPPQETASAEPQPRAAEPEPAPQAEAELEAEAELAEAELEAEAGLAAEESAAPLPQQPELATAESTRPGGAELPSPDPSNYAVTADKRVVIQGEETLGHYAEWLEVRASDLRRLNGMRYGTPLVIGRTVRLDFRNVSPETFEQRRLAYHQAIQDDFFSAYSVTGTTTHVLQPGDSLWYLAERKFRVPVWLLRQYNPDLDFGSLRAGARMVVPELEPRAG